MLKKYLELGEFVSTQGINGEIKLYPWSDNPDFATGFKKIYLSADGKDGKNVEAARVHKNTCVFRLEGVATIEQAHAFVGKTVWIARADANLPKGHFFIQDIFGAEVIDADSGIVYGKIVNVSQPGRHDIYEIEAEDGRRVLFPAVDEFVVKKDIEGGKVHIRPIKGMFDNNFEENA